MTDKNPVSETDWSNSSRTPSSVSQDARALRSGQALREALLVLLETTAFERITIRDITRQAGIHYATFFRHHESKESLLEEIAKDQIHHINCLTLAVRGTDDYKAGLQTLCRYVDEHRALLSTLLNGGAGATMREEWKYVARDVAQSEPHEDSWLPTQLGAVCAASLISETVAWWLAQPRDSYSVSEVSEILLRLLTVLVTPQTPRARVRRRITA